MNIYVSSETILLNTFSNRILTYLRIHDGGLVWRVGDAKEMSYLMDSHVAQVCREQLNLLRTTELESG